MISRNNYFTHYNKNCYLLKCNVFNRHGIAIVGAPTRGARQTMGTTNSMTSMSYARDSRGLPTWKPLQKKRCRQGQHFSLNRITINLVNFIHYFCSACAKASWRLRMRTGMGSDWSTSIVSPAVSFVVRTKPMPFLPSRAVTTPR